MPADKEQLKLYDVVDVDIDDDYYAYPKDPVLKEARKLYCESTKFWNEHYKTAVRDKRFIQTRQWDSETLAAREDRGLASIMMPMIGSFYRKISGKMLPSSIDISVTARNNGENGDEQSQDVASVIEKMTRYIDYSSKADQHKLKARQDQLSGGIGWLNVDFRQTDGSSDGDIVVLSPKNAFSIYVDPYSDQYDFSDARYAFEVIEMDFNEAKAKYGNKITRLANSYDDDGLLDYDDFTNLSELRSRLSTIDDNCKHWINDGNRKTIKIAKYYIAEEFDREYIILSDGREINREEWNEYQKEYRNDNFEALSVQYGEDIANQVIKESLEGLKLDKKKEKGKKIIERVITGWSILEERDFYIDEIPFTPVLGYTIHNEGGDSSYNSLIHDAVEIQEMINLLSSNAAKKAADNKAVAFIPHGMAADGLDKVQSLPNIDMYSYDPTADGTQGDGGSRIEVVQSPDNGSFELQQIQAYMEVLREITSVNDNSFVDKGVVNSAAQLDLQLTERQQAFFEMDANWKNALTSHYKKVVKMISAIYQPKDYTYIIDTSDDGEVVASQEVPYNINSYKYDVSIGVQLSGSTKERKKQSLIERMMSTGNPVMINGLVFTLIDSMDIEDKDTLRVQMARSMMASGQQAFVPPNLVNEVLEEQARTGELQQQVQQQAQQMSQQMAQEQVQQMLQDSTVQAQMATNEALVVKSQSDVQKAQITSESSAIKAQSDVAQSQMSLQQESMNTKQSQLSLEQQKAQLLQQIIKLQIEIAKANQAGAKIELEKMQMLDSLLSQADVIGLSISTI